MSATDHPLGYRGKSWGPTRHAPAVSATLMAMGPNSSEWGELGFGGLELSSGGLKLTSGGLKLTSGGLDSPSADLGWTRADLGWT